MGEIRSALQPVLDWYLSDEHPERPMFDVVTDIVSDLQNDRTTLLSLQKMAQEAKRMCEDGHPVSAFNFADAVLSKIKE